MTPRTRLLRPLLAAPMLLLLVSPVLALVANSSVDAIRAGLAHPLFLPALALSAKTSLISLGVVITLGTPLAWWISTATPNRRRLVQICVDLPMVLPPAVVGIGLLLAFGRMGLAGPALARWGWRIPFTTAAVVLAQVVVSAPFYIQSAAQAGARLDPDLRLVARTLGKSSRGAFLSVALPLALPGLLGGAALSFGRALGEFGATLLFAGNMPKITQTMPLAILSALESDVRVALALALVLAVASVALLLALRSLPRLGAQRP